MSCDRFTVSVLGLKKSGKTAVCEALIAALTARGYAVAAMKYTHAARLDLDREGSDSFKLARAGAGFLVVQAGEETLTLEHPVDSTEPSPGLLDRVPRHYQFVVSEGGQAKRSDALVICLKSRDAWDATLQTRRIPLEKIIALSGRFSHTGNTFRRGRQAAESGELDRFPVVDIRNAAAREALMDLILKKAGYPSPRAKPAGTSA